MKLKGKGSYIITDVKEFKVTDAFLGLDLETIGCQNQETFEDCTTKYYFTTIKNNCNCVPFGLRNYSSTNNMNVCVVSTV